MARSTASARAAEAAAALRDGLGSAGDDGAASDAATPSLTPASPCWAARAGCSRPPRARSSRRPARPLDRGSGQPSVLVFAKRLDGAFLTALGADFGLLDLSFVEQPPADGRAAVRLPTPAARAAWWIAWRPQRPGHGQLGWLLPALLGSVLFCGFTIVVVRNSDRASRAIHASEARFRDIAEAASDWIWETDHDLRLTYVSDQCARETRAWIPTDLIGRPRPRSPPAYRRPRIARPSDIAALAADGPFRGALFPSAAAGGEARASLRVAGKPVLDGARSAAIAARRPTSRRRLTAHEQVRFLAHHDALTGLPNRLV